MPCNDCSRTETCPPCPHEEQEKPEPQDVHKGPPCSGCGHPQHSQRCSKMTELGEDEMGHCGCLELTALNDIIETCRRAGGCPMHPVLKDVRPTESDYLKCRCGHFQQTHRPSTEGGCRGMACDCDSFKLAPDPEEPPLTPEEEEEASETQSTPSEGPEYTPCVCGHIEPEHEPNRGECNAYNCDCSAYCTCEHPNRYSPGRRTQGDSWLYCPDCEAKWYDTSPMELLPPQPDRRPPYLLAYSVQGHLYEAALPGDAIVAALDGRLVITHRLGPVAGICQIAPITSEEN